VKDLDELYRKHQRGIVRIYIAAMILVCVILIAEWWTR
jgi:uncharacterized membrane-anchored protein